ncbi:hypothetical protein A1O3_10126 [Capronia epimyces CBS 606.96]|uniref:Uncharacterized protein n=1 Tax=Capronia epimyces CBS 606.96 TaxID=1182542 RepID=W9Y3E2_9EURO|nr:uncharacterized protein A1O3_10126 [Capronia epimyces CBS 606.96]EXJ76969.1 hypothetical protein A1O3_10126 [Capronia epimyces CBS 606.96]
MDPETDQLIIHFKHMARMSTIRSDMESISAGAKLASSKAPDIHRQLLQLRDEFKRHLLVAFNPETGNRELREGPDPEDNMLIVFCKDALGLILVNLALLDLYSLALQDSYHVRLSEDYLNLEIQGLMELANSRLRRAIRASPFSCRRLISTYRAIYLDVRQGGDHHGVWDQIYAMLSSY